MKKHLLSGTVLILTAFSFSLFAADWTQWRGPNQDGSASESNLPSSWSQTKNIIWKTPLPGPSGATPIISNGKVFIPSIDKENKQVLAMCFDEKTGKELWRKVTGTEDRNFPRNNLVSPSAVTDGHIVIFTFGNGDIIAFDFDGNQLWHRQIEKEYGNLALMFGYSNTPCLYKGILYVIVLRCDKVYRDPQSDKPLESFVLALDSKTGKNIWKQARPTDAVAETHETYSTPIIYKTDNREELLVSGATYITAHDLKTGKELWRYQYMKTDRGDYRTIPTPLLCGDILVGTLPKHTGTYAIDLSNPGELKPAQYKWFFDGSSPDCTTPLFYKDNLYVLDGIKSGKTVSCINPNTGEIKWQQRIGGRGPWRASMTASDNKIYCISEGGSIIVFEASGTEFKPLFESNLKEDPIQASIAIANNKLFIRTADNLYCIGK